MDNPGNVRYYHDNEFMVISQRDAECVVRLAELFLKATEIEHLRAIIRELYRTSLEAQQNKEDEHDR